MPSFDIVSELNMQEIDNAVNQAQKEIVTRYDFKGAKAEIRVVFEELFRRLPDIRVPDGVVPERGDSSLVLAINRLPAIFTPA